MHNPCRTPNIFKKNSHTDPRNLGPDLGGETAGAKTEPFIGYNDVDPARSLGRTGLDAV